MSSDVSCARLGISWSAPIALERAVRGDGVPAEPGLYRIRRVGADGWDYIGQTGAGQMNLRRRMAMLKGVYAADMPYRDPHTAAPGLWALAHATGDAFEVSFCPVQGDTPWRKALEGVAIAAHRQQHGRSPTLNFGRMPAGYQMSSANNARLAAAGKRLRGGPCEEALDAHAPGTTPLGALDPDWRDAGWCGHRWSAWQPMSTEAIGAVRDGAGLYRIEGRGELVYVGEGAVRQRLLAHAAKLTTATAQGRAFTAGAPLSFSTVAGALVAGAPSARAGDRPDRRLRARQRRAPRRPVHWLTTPLSVSHAAESWRREGRVSAHIERRRVPYGRVLTHSSRRSATTRASPSPTRPPSRSRSARARPVQRTAGSRGATGLGSS